MNDIPSRLSGALADRYRLERELGHGGMATVYLVHDLKHKRPVALKVLNPELSHVVGTERFRREIETAAQLDHPHILPVHDSGEAAGQLWYTMPYVEGESLRDRMQRERQLPLEDALRLIREVADALGYAHRHGVVHRDVKPENILLSGEHARVADFGIAKAVEVAGGEQLTGTGLALGTPAYMSPEQASGGVVDGRSDQYSLGCVLYEMLAGEPPFTGTTPQAIIARRFMEPAPSIRRLRPGVPAPLEAALARVLALEPVHRFPTTTEFARALGTAEVTQPRGTAGVPNLTAKPIRQRMPPGVSRLILVVLLGLGVFLAWQRSAEPGGTSPDPMLLAVLPFENLGDSTAAYLVEGVSDAVRGKLAALPGLQVIAGASSSEYRHTAKPLRDIARELGVRYLLVGKVGWQDGTANKERVQVSSELVEVRGRGVPITRWQEPLEAPLTDVFRVQADIASRVAEALGVALRAGERAGLVERPTQSLAAYDAFLRGEAAAEGRAMVAVQRAVEDYEQAVAADPAFVPAWAQLSRALSLLYYNTDRTEALARRARRAAEKTLGLAPQRPEGWVALGDYAVNVSQDPARALTYYGRARQMAPANADLLTATAFAERILGRWDSALVHLRAAQTLDPRSVGTAASLVETLVNMRRYSEALAVVEQALAMAPRNVFLIQTKALVYLGRGDLATARAWIQASKSAVATDSLLTYFAISGDLYWSLGDQDQRRLVGFPPAAFGTRKAWGEVLSQVHALWGDRARSRAYADSALAETPADCGGDAQCHAIKAVQLAFAGRKAEAIREGNLGVRAAPITRDAFLGAYVQHQLVRVYLIVGEPERALDQLEPLLKIPYAISPGWLRIDPTFAPLRGHPRFERLLVGS